MNLAFEINKAQLEKILKFNDRIDTALSDGLQIAGRAVSNMLRKHFRKVNADNPNKMGARRTNFWDEIAQSVHSPKPVGPDEVHVSISHPVFRQKLYGGTIVPKEKQALTIPVHVDAYARRAFQLEEALGVKLFPWRSENDNTFLAAEHAGELTLYYLLKKKVTQKPDPNALPADSEFEKTIDEALSDFIDHDLKAK